ncbi:unnamed protein product [Amoebophrya sp. A120]|nr:unnamed protein product [Amoebophrya sp. A120]|eukprot:GSA120T00021913001.1
MNQNAKMQHLEQPLLLQHHQVDGSYFDHTSKTGTADLSCCKIRTASKQDQVFGAMQKNYVLHVDDDKNNGNENNDEEYVEFENSRSRSPQLVPPPGAPARRSFASKVALQKRLLDFLYLLSMCLVGLTSNIVCSLIAPILPAEYAKLNIDVTWVGSVFAVYSVAVLLFTPVISEKIAAKNSSSSKNSEDETSTSTVSTTSTTERTGKDLVDAQMKTTKSNYTSSTTKTRITILLFGLLLQGLSAILFGYTPIWFASNPEFVLYLQIFTRLLGGIGQAFSNLAIFSMVADRFVDDLGLVMGLNEVIIGVGFSCGPPIGSWLELIGGSFSCPFLVSGCLMLFVAVPVVVLLAWFELGSRSNRKILNRSLVQPEPGNKDNSLVQPPLAKAKVDAKNVEQEQAAQTPTRTPSYTKNADKITKEEEATTSNINLYSVLAKDNFAILIPAGFLFLGTFVFGLVEPIYAIHAKQFLHLDVLQIGYMYAILSISYSLCGVPAGTIADREKLYLRSLKLGAGVSGFCLLLLGLYHSVLLGEGRSDERRTSTDELQECTVIEAVILVLLGLGQALLLVPTLPAMKQTQDSGIHNLQDGQPMQKSENTNNTNTESVTEQVVALFNIFTQLGLIIGPLLGAWLRKVSGFSSTMLLGAVMVWGYLAVVLLRTGRVGGGGDRVTKATSSSRDEKEESTSFGSSSTGVVVQEI